MEVSRFEGKLAQYIPAYVYKRKQVPQFKYNTMISIILHSCCTNTIHQNHHRWKGSVMRFIVRKVYIEF